jgi:hypothetical protein
MKVVMVSNEELLANLETPTCLFITLEGPKEIKKIHPNNNLRNTN